MKQRIWRFITWLTGCSNENQDYCFIPNICHEILYMPKGMRKVSITNSKNVNKFKSHLSSNRKRI